MSILDKFSSSNNLILFIRFLKKIPSLWNQELAKSRHSKFYWAPNRISFRDKILPFYSEEYAAVGKFGTGCVYDRIKQKIIKLGGKINLKETVIGLKSNGNRVIEIKTTKKTYHISLKGRSRFRIKKTHLTQKGYLKSYISENEFKDDTDEINIDKNFKFSNSNALKTVLKSYLKNKKLSSNWDYINATSNLDLVNQLSMICPFSIQEKQMLLESSSINDRYILLTSILQNSTSSNEEKKSIKH